jgi:ATP-dependent protease ClpP protease subunit
MTKRYKDNEQIWTWFDQNLDTESRTIFMGSVGKNYNDDETGVDSFMAEYFIKGMYLLERKSADQEINIIMNNPGGEWYHGMAIYDAMMSSPCHCTVKVYGHAMSMGSIILQAADHRIMMPNSRFMIHYGYNGSYGHSKIYEKWADEGKKIGYQMENIYIEKMLEKSKVIGSTKLCKNLSAIVNQQRAFEIPSPSPVSYVLSKTRNDRKEDLRKIVREMLNFDTILDAEETVSIGFADEVFQKDTTRS